MGAIAGTGRVSRRAALRAGGGGVAAAFAVRGAGAARAQDATPQIVQDWIDAWNSDDPATNVAALYAADAVYEDTPLGLTNVNTNTDVAGFVRGFAEQISDIEVKLRAAFGTDDWAAAEWEFSFNYTGQLAGLFMGQLAPLPPGSGQHIVWLGATIYELAGGKITRSADYYDNTGLVEAVGLVAMPAATPEP